MTDIVIAGGGAAGFMAAITCAEAAPDLRVTILEKSPEPLAKVAISGGGRCNVTHACFEPGRLCEFYPRGSRELRGPFARFQPSDTMEWFSSRGVGLKTEDDGRVFPDSDKSSSITECLLNAARKAGVIVRTESGIVSARRDNGGFQLDLTDGSTVRADKLMLATGGNLRSAGYGFASDLGHTIEPPVPSLFTFQVPDPLISDLPGLSVQEAFLSVSGTSLRTEGPLLITHEGFSGPAVLKLSAWGARVLHDLGYAFEFVVRWNRAWTTELWMERFQACRREQGGRQIHSHCQEGIPQRLWRKLAIAAGIQDLETWGRLKRPAAEDFADRLGGSRFHVTGKSTFKEEFVTCGGVRLSEINFKRMESRICPGLFFGGEVLDIDGLTGGFNLQAAWTTGYLAGQAMAI